MDDIKHLKNLGSHKTKYQYDNPTKDILETFENQYPYRKYITEFTFNEFTSLCVSGDTLIDVARDEEAFPKGIPIKDLVGTEGIVFGFDLETKQPVARRYHAVRKTREHAPVVDIHLLCISNDGKGHIRKIPKKITVTPDHPVLISTGWGKFRWIEAKDLQPDMRLVADQRTGDSIRGKARHRLIMEYLLGRELQEGELIHHLDFRHYNNIPSNLYITNQSEHSSFHQHVRYGYNKKLPDTQTLVNLYNSGQENFHSLAKKFGCDESTITSRIGHLVKKRTQSESLLAKPVSINLHRVMKECADFYEKGYTTTELADFYRVHPTTITQWIQKAGREVRTSLETKMIRKKAVLPSLNHKVVKVEFAGQQDVYNMEVDDVHNFFGDDVVLHNCPKTGQPDFATIKIRYIPDKRCIETKSLKLYFLSFRQYGSFMETITNKILEDCVAVSSPRWMEVIGIFNVRGGTQITVKAEYCEAN